MSTSHIASNPFALMMDPEQVFQAIERSERLNRLQRRVYHPLDKPLIPRVVPDVAKFDSAIDGELDSEA